MDFNNKKHMEYYIAGDTIKERKIRTNDRIDDV